MKWKYLIVTYRNFTIIFAEMIYFPVIFESFTFIAHLIHFYLRFLKILFEIAESFSSGEADY